jgi:hypothetical protein
MARYNNDHKRAGNRAGRKTRAGEVLLAVSALLMLADLGLAAAGLPHFLATLGADAIGIPAAASLMILRFCQAVAFHPATLLPFACGILVVFLAFAGMLTGLILLSKRTMEKA